jgi:hypothetical protein
VAGVLLQEELRVHVRVIRGELSVEGPLGRALPEVLHVGVGEAPGGGVAETPLPGIGRALLSFY